MVCQVASHERVKYLEKKTTDVMGIANCNHRHAPWKYARWDCRDYEISDSVNTFCRDIGGKNAEEHRISNPCWVETTSNSRGLESYPCRKTQLGMCRMPPRVRARSTARIGSQAAHLSIFNAT